MFFYNFETKIVDFTRFLIIILVVFLNDKLKIIMVEDKYKIRLSEKSYISLLEDMEEFNFKKPNGKINKNKFYTSLLNGYYEEYKEKVNTLALILKEKSNIKHENYINILSNIINQKLLDYSFSEKGLYNYTQSIFIQVTKENRKIINEIETNSLLSSTMSEFIRNLINSYISEPKYKRERSLFINNYNIIKQAIAEHKELEITTHKDNKIKFIPYEIMIDNNRLNNYVVGYIKNGTKLTPMSIKLFKIESITTINYIFNLEKEDITQLKNLLKNGPDQLGISLTNIIIKFDKKGLRDFQIFKDNRIIPKNLDNETGIYEFYCDENRLYDYLKQFGKHIKVISPLTLKEKLNKFHKEAVDEE